jgi:excinuclease ABC subunit C
MSNLQDEIDALPFEPGIYQYFDKNEKIIYVGKAKSLKKRVQSYFNKNVENGKTRVLVSQIVSVKYVIASSEIEALLMENNFIKEHKPKYNILLKDDKTYPWICIKNEAFPRVIKTRRVEKDGAKYYGPYASVRVLNTLLDLFKQLYPLRTCNLDLSQSKIDAGVHKVCLEYHLKNCKGPCVGEEKKIVYDSYISSIDGILKGNYAPIMSQLNADMLKLSENFEFEEAQIVKDKIDAMKAFEAKSTVVSATISDVDVIGIRDDESSAFVNYLIVRNGAIIQGHTVEIKKKLDETEEEILAFSLINFREQFQSESKEIISSKEFTVSPDMKIHIPQRGDKKHLLDLSEKNAKFFRLEKLKQEKLKNPQKHTDRILGTMQKDLRLSKPPVHIECFDNSNFQGTNAVGACVVFKNGKPSKKDYRNFNIKTVEGPDDFASMEEVVYRRYKRLVDEGKDLPQLVVIDGGKGQLGSAVKSLNKLNLMGEIAVIGIAKRLEEIYFPGDSIPIYLDKRSESLKIIQFLRNEAHRFGITHHRQKRSKGAIESELTKIKGIGEKTFETLILHFKSVKRIKEASEKEIEEVIGLSKAKILMEALK